MFTPETGLQISFPGEHRLQLHTAIWVREQALIDKNGDTTYGFSVPLARTIFQASVLDGFIETFLQPEFAGEPRLLDAQIDFNFIPEARLRLGYFRTNYSRAFLTPIVALTLPGRGTVSDGFRIDRLPGVMFFGNAADGKLEYSIGSYAVPPTKGQTNAAPAVIARLAYNIGEVVPYDQVPALRGSVAPGGCIGIGGAFQRQENTASGSEVHLWHAAIDISVMAGPFFMTAEGFYRQSKDGDQDISREWGTFAQAGVLVVPKILELAFRGSWMDRLGEGLRSEYEAGLNVYIPTPNGSLGHHTKILFAYGYAEAEFEEIAEVIPHTVTIQVQASF
jgi:hypothetical protein